MAVRYQGLTPTIEVVTDYSIHLAQDAHYLSRPLANPQVHP